MLYSSELLTTHSWIIFDDRSSHVQIWKNQMIYNNHVFINVFPFL